MFILSSKMIIFFKLFFLSFDLKYGIEIANFQMFLSVKNFFFGFSTSLVLSLLPDN